MMLAPCFQSPTCQDTRQALGERWSKDIVGRKGGCWLVNWEGAPSKMCFRCGIQAWPRSIWTIWWYLFYFCSRRICVLWWWERKHLDVWPQQPFVSSLCHQGRLPNRENRAFPGIQGCRVWVTMIQCWLIRIVITNKYFHFIYSILRSPKMFWAAYNLFIYWIYKLIL